MGVDAILTGVPQFDKLEVIKTGIFTMDVSSGTTSGSFNHNLGFRPLAIVYSDDADPTVGSLPLPDGFGIGFSSGAVNFSDWRDFLVTETHIHFYYFGSAVVGATASFRFYLLRPASNA